MRASLAASLGVHVGILVAALFVLPNPSPHEAKPVEAIEVDISKIGEVSKKTAMTKEPEKKAEKPAPKKSEATEKADAKAKLAEKKVKAATEPAAAPPPEPEPKEAKKEEPKKAEKKPEEPKPLDPDPLKDLLKTVEEAPPEKAPEKPKEQKTAEKKPEKKPEKKKPEKKKPKLDVDQMEAFLNKIDDESSAPVESSQEDGAPAQGEANLQGTDDELSATIIQALVQRIRECWSVPPGAREASIVVKLRFGLNTDGSVAGAPQVMNQGSDPLYEATARSAVAAVMECQSYDFLPQDKYDLWKDLIINFNPNMMFDS